MRVAPTLRRDYWLTFVGLAALAVVGGVTAEQPLAWVSLGGLGCAMLVTPLIFGLGFNKRAARRWLWMGAALVVLLKLLLVGWVLIGLAQPDVMVGFRWAGYAALAILSVHGSIGIVLAGRGWQRYWRVRQRTVS